VAGVYGVVRLLAQVRAAAEALLAEMPGGEPWSAESVPHPADYLFLALAEQRGGRRLSLRPSFPPEAEKRVRLSARLDGLTPAAAPPGRPADVLVVASMERFLHPLAPVLPALAGQAAVTLLVPRAGREWPTVRALPDTVEVLAVEDRYTPDVAAVFADWQARGRRLWETEQERLCERFTVAGISLWEILGVGMEEVFLDLLPHAAAYVEMARALCAGGVPGVVAAAKLQEPLENAFFAVAGEECTCRMLAMHGHISPYPQHFFAQGRFAAADRVCVWGEYYLPVLARHLGADLGRKTVVTGNPAWDGLALDARTGARPCAPSTLGPAGSDRVRMRARAAEVLEAPRDAFRVLYLSDVISVRQYPLVQAVVADMPDAFLIVKVHPGEREEEYRRQRLPALEGRAVVIREEAALPLHDLLRAGDVAVTYSSTTALESILAGTPVLGLAADPVLVRRYPTVDWSNYGIPVARTREALAQALRTLAADTAARGRLLAQERVGIRPFVGADADGGATAAVEAEILAALQNVHVAPGFRPANAAQTAQGGGQRSLSRRRTNAGQKPSATEYADVIREEAIHAP
jgi:hypothetical protein